MINPPRYASVHDSETGMSYRQPADLTWSGAPDDEYCPFPSAHPIQVPARKPRIKLGAVVLAFMAALILGMVVVGLL